MVQFAYGRQQRDIGYEHSSPSPDIDIFSIKHFDSLPDRAEDVAQDDILVQETPPDLRRLWKLRKKHADRKGSLYCSHPTTGFSASSLDVVCQPLLRCPLPLSKFLPALVNSRGSYDEIDTSTSSLTNRTIIQDFVIWVAAANLDKRGPEALYFVGHQASYHSDDQT